MQTLDHQSARQDAWQPLWEDAKCLSRLTALIRSPVLFSVMSPRAPCWKGANSEFFPSLPSFSTGQWKPLVSNRGELIVLGV